MGVYPPDTSPSTPLAASPAHPAALQNVVCQRVRMALSPVRAREGKKGPHSQSILLGGARWSGLESRPARASFLSTLTMPFSLCLLQYAPFSSPFQLKAGRVLQPFSAHLRCLTFTMPSCNHPTCTLSSQEAQMESHSCAWDGRIMWDAREYAAGD